MDVKFSTIHIFYVEKEWKVIFSFPGPWFYRFRINRMHSFHHSWSDCSRIDFTTMQRCFNASRFRCFMKAEKKLPYVDSSDSSKRKQWVFCCNLFNSRLMEKFLFVSITLCEQFPLCYVTSDRWRSIRI